MERRGSRYRRGRGRSNRGGYREPVKKGPKLEETRIIDRTELPIYKCKDSIMSHIERYSVGIVEASTGSGKSTQVPQFLYEKYPECYIVVAQPNKLGANENC
jgi:HrpA-like RNA helicase